MKCSSFEGRQILLDHYNMKLTLLNHYSDSPERLAEEVERLTFVTLRRFIKINQFPVYDFDVDEGEL